ncbi:MAG: cytochrome c oxidase assembly protein [Microbacterium sp.]|nr:MAG: cytochrome c oxidase assembly protein [Microbacterium sp.]
MHTHASAAALGVDPVLTMPFVFGLVFYGVGVAIQRHRRRPWPWRRTAAWMAGVTLAAAGFVGPLASAAHDSLTAHLVAHVVVGMAAPVLLVLGAPVTLALRTLHVSRARRLSRLLGSAPLRLLGAPVIAAILNVGSLWLLHATPLYMVIRDVPLAHLVVMCHFLLAGVLLTATIIPTDPAPHRAGYPHRLMVLVAAAAVHGILAKSLYASPPPGVDVSDAQTAAQVMYYAGDAIDLTILLVLCARWYRHAGRKLPDPARVSSQWEHERTEDRPHGRRRAGFPRGGDARPPT